MGENDEFTNKLALPEIKKVKSTSIRNAHVQNLSYEVSAGNPEANSLYNELMTLSTDENFKKELTKKYTKIKTLTPGNVSPKFDYENFNGGKTSLESLKGKYVYIDVWATWCGPCRREIPSLQKVEEQYHGKNIEFVSLSIDAKKDYEKWRKFVEEKKLGGIQLFADSDWTSKFVQDYAIESIPRFILVDPNGNIVSADAPRPSDPKLVAKFEELGIK
jgi:thiol-disulfide isomerase/thioredoxin